MLLSLVLTCPVTCLLSFSLFFFSWLVPWASLSKGQVPPCISNFFLAVSLPFLWFLCFLIRASPLAPNLFPHIQAFSFPPAHILTANLTIGLCLANTAVGRCPGRATEEHRGYWKVVEQRADTWQNATAKRFPVESAVAWNGLGPRAWGLLFSVPC